MKLVHARNAQLAILITVVFKGMEAIMALDALVGSAVGVVAKVVILVLAQGDLAPEVAVVFNL
jgi:hypothetical protein